MNYLVIQDINKSFNFNGYSYHTPCKIKIKHECKSIIDILKRSKIRKYNIVYEQTNKNRYCERSNKNSLNINLQIKG